MNEISLNVANQLKKILSYLTIEQKNKIPNNIWQIINDKSIETENNLENILPETKKYLAYIFLNYLASEEEKKEYEKILNENEARYQKELNTKFNTDNLFKKKEIKSSEVTMVVYKENILQRIINKIKEKLFKR